MFFFFFFFFFLLGQGQRSKRQYIIIILYDQDIYGFGILRRGRTRVSSLRRTDNNPSLGKVDAHEAEAISRRQQSSSRAVPSALWLGD